MTSGGMNRKPVLQSVREGNPGKQKLRDAVVLPPSALIEPDWSEFVGEAGVEICHGLWVKLAPTLSRSVGLVGEQQETLVEYCLTYARIVENEKAISVEGFLIAGAMGGLVKNPRTTIVSQYRGHFRSLICELGLSPRAAAGISKPESSDEDDPFDN